MPRRGPDGGEWEIAVTRTQRWQAEMAQRLLESHGLRTWLESFDASAAAYPATGAQNVLVPAADVGVARGLLAAGVDTERAFEAAERAGGAGADAAAAERLEALLLDLLRVPSVTGEEDRLADWLGARYEGAGERVRRVGRSLVVGEATGERPAVLLMGHLDTVPPTAADREPRREGDAVVGRGASDMKSGVAVAMDCFEDHGLRGGAYDVLLVAYAGEEGPHETNELGVVLERVPELGGAGLAVVAEPTDLTVQLGCLGTLHADVVFRGRAAHSARPWHGENALTGAGAFLDELHRREPRDVDVDGLTYREVVTATTARTANARNVVPDELVVNLNYRFAPDCDTAEAERRLRDLVGDRATVAVTDRAPAAPPRRADPLVAAFVEATGGRVEPKQAWTDVARLHAAGVPALNYGPGLAAQAHQAGERVPLRNLALAREGIARFLAGRSSA